MIRIFPILFLGLLAFSSDVSLANEATPENLPDNARILGAATYRPETLRKLANPVLLYVDFDWLVEQGWNLETLTLEKLYDKYAYAIPMKGEVESAYTSETKTFYSDFYGGDLIGYNYGSGRVVTSETFQIKGAGPTSMLSKAHKANDTNKFHVGAVTLQEGIIETLKSQVAHNEFPQGANRVGILIKTGTKVKIGKIFENRAIIVRADEVRPAHFIENENLTGRARKKEKNRVDEIIHQYFENKTPPGLDDFFTNLYVQMGKSAGFAYANRLYSGGITASNIGMNGRIIDFGWFVGLDGYASVAVTPRWDYNGLNADYKRALTGLWKSVRQRLPHLLDKKRLELVFNNAAKTEMYAQFQSQFGMPSEMLKDHSSFIGDTFYRLAAAGNDNYINREYYPGRTGYFDIRHLLTVTASHLFILQSTFDESTMSSYLDSLLSPDIPDSDTRKFFIEEYMHVIQVGLAWAKQNDISRENFYKYIALASEIRSKRQIYINHEYLQKLHWQEIERDHINTNDPRLIQDALPQAIAASRRLFKEAEPFTLVLNEHTTADYGIRKQRIFNLKTGVISEKTVGHFLNRHKAVLPDYCRDVFIKIIEN